MMWAPLEPPDDVPPPALPVDVRRSTRRRRTVTARLERGTLVVFIPATFTPAEEHEWVQRMRVKMEQRRASSSDDDLLDRAHRLSRRHLDGRAVPASVRWVDNHHTRWGSCTPADGTIRLNRALAAMPQYVQDYVLLHELAHLIHAGHGPAFWALLADLPTLERARGYLEGYAAAQAAAGVPVTTTP
ncbi:hypothetical protein KEM60_02843 [Austwickia sp. TVS 96-490-7B]|uniref:M48 metallopeptidase family protein n=1 Tax=Austwickia sp. TVS 96-490-7B TaxID=2830843 RepID=UPI001E19A5B0|nr:M48 family metallopeptidase [Austwickia sp. TVS 96-490-7B]MBW3086614.1 hypothetical protein [Austwickia sp. TVS 96-490-7B]